MGKLIYKNKQNIEKNRMKIAVAGTGYVGLVTGVCLASKGHDVVCVDIDQDKVEKMRRGVLRYTNQACRN